jgi:CMP-N-acetylneuraminic acid synthetase
METFKVLGIIPARAGSKGVPNKNVRSLNGKPLLAYTIAAAKKARLLNDLIVSTESPQITRIAQKFKAKVPFCRPKELSRDSSPTLPVLQHALLEYERIANQHFTHVMLLQPTTPLRKSQDIDRAIRMLRNNPKRNSLISCYNGEGIHPRIMYTQKNGRTQLFITARQEMTRRQNFEKVFVRNGAIYLISRDLLLKKNRMIGDNPLIMEMPRWQSLNIDSTDDFRMAERMVR